MAYFDTNKENGKETIELASLMNEAASAADAFIEAIIRDIFE